MNVPWASPARAGDRARLDERRDVVVAVAERREHLVGVLAEARPGLLDLAGRARQLDRRAEQLDRLLRARLVELDDHLARAHELAVERLVETQHRLQAAVVVRRELLPLGARLLQEDALDLRVRLRAGRLELLLDQVLAADAAAPGLEELRLERAERHVAVGARVRPVTDERAGQLEAPALRRRLLGEVARRDHRQPRQRAVGHRDVDELALAAAVALAQRGQDPEGGHQRAAAEVGDLAGRLHGRAVLVAGQAEQPDQAEVVHVVARAVAERAVLAVAADRAVDDPRVLLLHPLVADAEPVEHARPERLEHDVVLLDELQQDRLALGLLEVDADRPLAAVEREEVARWRRSRRRPRTWGSTSGRSRPCRCPRP